MIVDQNQKLSNIPEFSVSELAGSLKRTLEDSYGRVRVRGELSRVTIPGSGHLYTALKDDGAVIDAVCWKGTLMKLGIRPEEGLEVICTGRITTYAQSSKYQLIIESMEMAGEGALLKMLEDRKKRLAAEGLFNADRKKNLPFLPEVIGVITSPTGAVIRDILHRLSDRFPRHVLVWPVLVQGQGSAEQIAAALNAFSAMQPGGPIPRPDLLIVARGGGSLEDLMPFNEEIVVRAAANCTIPLISAVGHETDTTLIDFASDRRAPTPTAAAEMAVPRRDQLWAQILDNTHRLTESARRLTAGSYEKLANLGARLENPARILNDKTQRLDNLTLRINGIFTQFLNAKERKLQQPLTKLVHPGHILDKSRSRLQNSSENLHRAGFSVLKDQTQKLESAGRLLDTLSFKSILARGFVVVRDHQGKAISDAANLHEGQNITLEFQDNQSAQAQITRKALP